MWATLKRAAHGAEDTISDGIPALTLNGSWIDFARFNAHIGLDPMTTTLREPFKKELPPSLSGKETATFPLDHPLPYTVIGRIVTLRVKETLRETDRIQNS